ncbi:DUF6973 domain-containing protein [Chryseobacterium indologenes]|uniref:DUF6973 domain-containing protein n=1 Tax=Chryseobacterium indologenes TaxID=253 RepID=UPI0009A1647A|nr:hypothetical protein [Chryseobacterium indologenes]
MKTRTQLGDLDLEVLNPIETKKIIGGDWYDYTNIGEVVIPWDGGGGGGDPWGDYYDPTHGGGDYGDTGGGGSGSGSSVSADAFGPGLELTLAERSFLAWQVPALALPKMYHNYSLAAENKGINNESDALRHALWSALDAADIGVDLARQFHTLHETEHPDTNNPAADAMDLHNNEWGYEWFQQHGDPENNMGQFEVDFNNAVMSGAIQTHP